MKVGVVLPLAEDERLGRAFGYREIRELALRAEAEGFDSLWVYDHLLHRFEGRPAVGFWESWTVLAAVAEATSRPALGTMVLCAGFRNPAVVAKMADSLDEVSSGRLILGLGAGWHRPEFDAFGLPFEHRVARFEEALQIVVPLLRHGRVDFTGAHHRAVDCELRPRGPRPGGPPIMVAAARPRMLDLAARYADLWNSDWLGNGEDVRDRIAPVRRACREAGRDPATLGITGAATFAFPEEGSPPSWLNDPGQCITGSPAEMAARLAPFAEAGVEHLIAWCYPMTAGALARLGRALRLHREATGP